MLAPSRFGGGVARRTLTCAVDAGVLSRLLTPTQASLARSKSADGSSPQVTGRARTESPRPAGTRPLPAPFPSSPPRGQGGLVRRCSPAAVVGGDLMRGRGLRVEVLGRGQAYRGHIQSGADTGYSRNAPLHQCYHYRNSLTYIAV